jgi:hypothetical protein
MRKAFNVIEMNIIYHIRNAFEVVIIMKALLIIFLVVLVFVSISMACDAAVICPEGQYFRECATDSYSWNGLTLRITKPGEYTFAHANFPDDISIKVIALGVTIDGTGVTLRQIDGAYALDLKNVSIYIDDSQFSGPAITECQNIVNSSIFVKSRSNVSGIGILDGSIDDTTSITVQNIHPPGTISQSSAYGIDTVHGTIFGGKITVTSTSQKGRAYGIGEVRGTISGGEFTVTSTGPESLTYGVDSLSGEISGGTFTITSPEGQAYGICEIWRDGEIFDGEFTVTSLKSLAYGIEVLWGKISGGTFTVTGNSGYGVWAIQEYRGDTGEISGGEFTVTGTSPLGYAYGVNDVYGTISGGTFAMTSTSPGYASGVNNVSGVISGGEFIITNPEDQASRAKDMQDNCRSPGGLIGTLLKWMLGVDGVQDNCEVS